MTARKATAAGAGGQARTVLRDAINKGLTPERVDALIDDAFGATTTQFVECPACGHSFKAQVSDVKKITDTLTALIQEAEGRPEQRATESANVVIVRPPL